MSTETQNTILRKHLDAGHSITVAQAINQLGIGSLPRRILDLKEGGYPVSGEFIRVRKRNGDMARVKEYKRA